MSTNNDRKSSWNATSTKLSNNVASLHKRSDDVFKISDPTLKECANFYGESNLEQSRLMKDYRSKLLTVKNDLSQVEAVLRGTSQKVSDGGALRFILEEFETKISNFRAQVKSNLSALESQAEQLWTEVEATTQLISDWDKQDEDEKSEQISRSASKKKAAEMKDRSSVTELARRTLEHQHKLGVIEKQLSVLGGPTGGWHFQDHDMFLRVWTQTQTVPVAIVSQHKSGDVGDKSVEGHSQTISADRRESTSPVDFQVPVMTLPTAQFSRLLTKLTPLLPQKSAQELEAHVVWYLQFLCLQHAKKELLSSWKRTRQVHNRQNDDSYSNLHSNLDISIGSVDPVEVNNNTGRLSSHAEWTNDRTQTYQIDAEEQGRAKERVAQWRQQREAQVARQQFLEKERAEQEAKLEAERRRKRLEEVRPLVQEWKQAREQEEAELRAALAEAERYRRALSVNRAEAERRRLRDLELAYKRRESVQARWRGNPTKAEKVEALSATVRFEAERDPHRLTRSTSAFRAQTMTALDLQTAEIMRAITPAHSRRIPLSGRDLKFSHRAIPAWMKPPTSKDKEEKVVALVSSILEDFQKDFASFYNVNVAQKPKPETTDLRLPKVPPQVEHLKRGNLFKTGDSNKSWKKRYFVVHNEKGDFKVEYFESDEGALKGWFNPAGYYADTFTPEEQKSLGTFGIKLVPYMGQRRVWYMRAENEADRTEWMNVFDSACSRAQPQNDADSKISNAFYSALDTIRYKYNDRGWYYRYGTEMDRLFDFIEMVVYRDLAFLAGTKTNSTVTTQVHKIIQDDVSSVWNKATKEASDRTIALDMSARGSAKQFMEHGVQLKNRTIEILAPTIRPFVAEHGAKTLRPILSNLVGPVAIAFSQSVQFFYTSLTSKYDSGELNTPPKRKTVIKNFIKRCECHWVTESLLYYSAMTIAAIYNNNPQTPLHFPKGGFALTDVKHLVLDRVRELMYRALENFYTISEECTTTQVTDKIVRATHTYLKDASVMIKNTLTELMRNILSTYVVQLWFPGGLTLQPIQTTIDTITVGGLSQLFHVNALVRDVTQDVIERTIVSAIDTHREEYEAIINKVQSDVMLPEDPDKGKEPAAAPAAVVDDADL